MEQVEFYKNKLQYELDSCDLKKALNNDESIVIVDTRSQRSYSFEHIKGAINLPHREMSEETTADFDKNILYVTYCDGFGCNASTKGAYNLSKLGFKVKELIGGIASWKYEGNEVATLLNEEEFSESQGCGPTCGCKN